MTSNAKNRELCLKILVPAILIMIFKGSYLQTFGLINAFNLELAKHWTIENLTPFESTCIPVDELGYLDKMQAWLEKIPDSEPRKTLFQGQLACLQGSVLRAEEFWKQSGNRFPALLYLAISSFANGHKINTSFQNEIGDYGYYVGVWNEQENKPHAAVEWLSFSLAYNPKIRTGDKLAYLYQVQGKDVRVKEIWQWFIDMFPVDDVSHWVAVGRIAELGTEWRTAAAAYQKGAQLAESQTAYDLLVRAGKMWQQEEVYDKAEKELQQALILNPQKVEAYLQMGEVYRHQGQYEKAIEQYLQAQVLSPNHYAPSYYLGLVSFAQQDYFEAIANFDKSLSLLPGSPWVLYYKAVSLDALGQRKEASVVLDIAISNLDEPLEDWLILQDNWK